MFELPRTLTLSLRAGDVLDEPADVLVLKHAQGLHGIELELIRRAAEAGRTPEDLAVAIGEARWIPEGRGSRAARLLVVGTEPLRDFSFGSIRRFARTAAQQVAGAGRPLTVLVTLHGAGIGLDERGALQQLVRGWVEGHTQAARAGTQVELRLVERQRRRAERLQSAIDELFQERGAVGPAGDDALPLAFVAMPFGPAFDDVFHYGIRQPLQWLGMNCERVDEAKFEGPIVDRILQRIREARVVVADLSDHKPNVFLEVGYAWGCGRPTVLLYRGEPESLPFDVRHRKVLVYRTIRELERLLTEEVTGLLKLEPPKAAAR